MAEKVNPNGGEVTDDEGWEEHGGTLYRFEHPGDVIQGQLLVKRTIEVANPAGGSNTIGQYVIRLADGMNILVNGSADIDAKMAEIDAVVNLVRIKYEGEERTGKGTRVRKFKVQSRPA